MDREPVNRPARFSKTKRPPGRRRAIGHGAAFLFLQIWPAGWPVDWLPIHFIGILLVYWIYVPYYGSYFQYFGQTITEGSTNIVGC